MTSTVLVVHGAGSSPDVAAGAFPPGVAASWWLRGHGPRPAPTPGDDGAGDRADLAAEVSARRPTVVAGISYGAHQVARWAAGGGARGTGVGQLLLLLPAWTGPPGALAALTAAQADEFAADGIAAALDRVRAAVPGWVAESLAISWPQHDAGMVAAALRQVAASHGPSEDELAAIRLPVTLVAHAGDPLHPPAVAARWRALIPAARLVTVPATALSDLGTAGLRAAGRPGPRSQAG